MVIYLNSFLSISIMLVFKGKRGKVYKILNFAIKVKNKDSKSIGRIGNEVKWLKKLNTHGIGPKLYYGNDNFLVSSFIKGEPITDYFKHCSHEDKTLVIKEVFRQCYILDKLKVDKFEMHRPLKHIIIKKDRKSVV